MPRGVRNKSSTLSTTSDTDTPDSSTVRKPSWNTSPNTLPSHLIALKRWIYTADTRYKQLIETGTVIERKEILCMSDNHIDRIISETLDKGTFEEPCVVDAEDIELDGISPEHGGAGATEAQITA